MELKTHKELYAELKKEPHGQLAKMAADFVLQLRDERKKYETMRENIKKLDEHMEHLPTTNHALLESIRRRLRILAK